jgi:hypothetical protein
MSLSSTPTTRSGRGSRSKISGSEIPLFREDEAIEKRHLSGLMLVLSVSAAIPERKPPKNARELEAFRHEITDKIKKLLNFKRFEQPLDVQPLVTTQRKGYSVEKRTTFITQ